MNTFLPPSFVERVQRLALGLEPIDAERGTRIAHPIRVTFDEEMTGLARPSVARHDSCLHALLYHPGLASRVRLRFFEDLEEFIPRVRRRRVAGDLAMRIRGVARRYVPRRISFPILTVAEAEAGSHQLRVRRPFLFPGAAYDLASGMTGLRGRVERDGATVRWSRVVATLPESDTVVGRAHGDDRGEFLLLISSAAGAIGDLTDPLPIRVTVSGPAVAPVPEFDDLPEQDPLWDLPEEPAQLLDPGDPGFDAVSSGESLPPGYTASVTRDMPLELGRIASATEAFVIP